MSEIVKLVTEWDAFEKEHKNASIEDFCRYYLIKEREAKKKDELFGGHMPPEINSTMAKLIGRLSSIMVYHFKNSVKQENNIDIEWFTLINVIHFRKECRKTDAITECFLELSTGIDILNRLHKNGYISERGDPSDKRARLVKLTAKGEGMLIQCWKSLGKISFFIYNDLETDDKKIVLQLLSNIDTKHSKIIAENKGKDIDTLLTEYGDHEGYKTFRKQMDERHKKHKK
jgi:DNA-binding MarR family transcriptional regulator